MKFNLVQPYWFLSIYLNFSVVICIQRAANLIQVKENQISIAIFEPICPFILLLYGESNNMISVMSIFDPTLKKFTEVSGNVLSPNEFMSLQTQSIVKIDHQTLFSIERYHSDTKLRGLQLPINLSSIGQQIQLNCINNSLEITSVNVFTIPFGCSSWTVKPLTSERTRHTCVVEKEFNVFYDSNTLSYNLGSLITISLTQSNLSFLQNQNINEYESIPIFVNEEPLILSDFQLLTLEQENGQIYSSFRYLSNKMCDNCSTFRTISIDIVKQLGVSNLQFLLIDSPFTFSLNLPDGASKNAQFIPITATLEPAPLLASSTSHSSLQSVIKIQLQQKVNFSCSLNRITFTNYTLAYPPQAQARFSKDETKQIKLIGYSESTGIQSIWISTLKLVSDDSIEREIDPKIWDLESQSDELYKYQLFFDIDPSRSLSSIEIGFECTGFNSETIQNNRTIELNYSPIVIPLVSTIFDNVLEIATISFDLPSEFSSTNISESLSLIVVIAPGVIPTEMNSQNLIISGITYTSISWEYSHLIRFDGIGFVNEKHQKISIQILKSILSQDIITDSLLGFSQIRCLTATSYKFVSQFEPSSNIAFIESNTNPPTSPANSISLVEFTLGGTQASQTQSEVSLTITFTVNQLNTACPFLLFVLPPEIEIYTTDLLITLASINLETQTINQTLIQNMTSSNYSASSILLSLISEDESSNLFISTSILTTTTTYRITLNKVISPSSPSSLSDLNLYQLHSAVFLSNQQTPLTPPLHFTSNDSSSHGSFVFPSSDPMRLTSTTIPSTRFTFLESFSAEISSKYPFDISTLTISLALPIRLINQIHFLTISLNNLTYVSQSYFYESIHCTPELQVIPTINQLEDLSIPHNSFSLNIIDQDLLQNTPIQCRIHHIQTNSNLASIQAEVYHSKLNSDQTHELLSTATVNLNSPINIPWIQISEIQVSSQEIGKRSATYTFIVNRVEIDIRQSDEQNQDAQDLNSAFSDSTQKYLNISILNNQNSNLVFAKIIVCKIQSQSIPCRVLENQIIIKILDIPTITPFSLEVSGLSTPYNRIIQNKSNNIEIPLSFSFSLSWQDPYNSDQSIEIGEAITFTQSVKLLCDSSCIGCSEYSKNCLACAQEFPYSRWNDQFQRLECVASCAIREFFDPISLICVQCEIKNKDKYCIACSSHSPTKCSKCIEGFSLSETLNNCIPSNLINNRIRVLGSSTSNSSEQSTTAAAATTSTATQIEQTSTSSQSSVSETDSNETKEGSAESEQKTTSEKIEARLTSLMGEAMVLSYSIIGSLILTIFGAVKTRFRSEKQRNSFPFKASACMLWLLSLCELIEYPYLLIWAISITNGDFSHPITMGILGQCAFSCVEWILGCAHFLPILVLQWPIRSSLLNPVPLRWRNSTTSRTLKAISVILTKLTRLFVVLNAKTFCVIFSNVFDIQGWFSYTFGVSSSHLNVLMFASLRKILAAQAFMNIVGATLLASFIQINYVEIQDNYATIYDAIFFRLVMCGLCVINVSTIDSLIKAQESKTKTNFKQIQS